MGGWIGRRCRERKTRSLNICAISQWRSRSRTGSVRGPTGARVGFGGPRCCSAASRCVQRGLGWRDAALGELARSRRPLRGSREPSGASASAHSSSSCSCWPTWPCSEPWQSPTCVCLAWWGPSTWPWCCAASSRWCWRCLCTGARFRSRSGAQPAALTHVAKLARLLRVMEPPALGTVAVARSCVRARARARARVCESAERGGRQDAGGVMRKHSAGRRDHLVGAAFPVRGRFRSSPAAVQPCSRQSSAESVSGGRVRRRSQGRAGACRTAPRGAADVQVEWTFVAAAASRSPALVNDDEPGRRDIARSSSAPSPGPGAASSYCCVTGITRRRTVYAALPCTLRAS